MMGAICELNVTAGCPKANPEKHVRMAALRKKSRIDTPSDLTCYTIVFVA
jgi:hypothetical protein